MGRRSLIPLLSWVATTGLCLALLPLACGSDAVKSPFGSGAGGADGVTGGGGEAGFKLQVDAGGEADPTLGGPCEDDGQCDDEVSCTQDRCDQALRRCRFEADDASCDDGVYCDGKELCDVREGCREGEPIACSDDSTCTIDVCVELTQSCRHDPRDADGDGDPTWNCGGADCDDVDPLVSSSATEVCGNGRDDDCDKVVDEPECEAPEHDTCQDALEVAAPGYYDLNLTATAFDFATECASQATGFRDAVVALIVPAGAAQDVDVVAKVDGGQVSLGTAAVCGSAASTRCEPSFPSPLGASVSRLLLRGLAPGAYPLYIAGTVEATVQLRVDFRVAEPEPLGELCEQALPLIPGAAPQLFRLPDYRRDVASECHPKPTAPTPTEPNPAPRQTGDAFVGFSLAEASDVTLVAEAQDDLGLPVISLLNAGCEGELTCRKSQPGRLFVRALPAGSYVVALSGTGPADVQVRLELSPVSDSPPGEGCVEPPVLEVGDEQITDLRNYEDAVHPRCRVGAPDAAFGFELSDAHAAHDVALIGRLSDGDEGGVSIATPSCGANLACSSGVSILRAYRYGLSAGNYRAVIESVRGNPVGLSRFERPAAPAVYVPFSDDCAALVTVPETGGNFSGTTANAFPDFDGGCDVGGQPRGGAPDQILKFSLSAARRVIFDMGQSNYDTMLSVRTGDSCPGIELPLACAPGYVASRSFLDLDLQAGDYFIQIDGYDGASGSWNLVVFSAPL